jgi:hypothetical protein
MALHGYQRMLSEAKRNVQVNIKFLMDYCPNVKNMQHY